MKAIIIEQFGGLDKLKISEVASPEPSNGEVRIKIAYSSVNPVDWKIREGRLAGMFPHHFPLILGWDASGVIDKVGKNVTKFKVGDSVYAYARKAEVQWGTYAEYVVLNEEVVAPAPKTVGLDQAATVPLVGLTAWQAIHRFESIKPDQNVLIHGGAGGVGGFAIQFAKLLGAKVIATGSSANIEYLKSLGATRVIDYQFEDFSTVIQTEIPEGVDFVLDTLGGDSLKKSYSLVRKDGVLISIVEEPNEAKSRAAGIQSAFVFVSPNAKELIEISKLIDEKKIKIPEFRVFPMEEVRRAHELSQSGHVRGKILLKP